jgi:hypothetical protein
VAKTELHAQILSENVEVGMLDFVNDNSSIRYQESHFYSVQAQLKLDVIEKLP